MADTSVPDDSAEGEPEPRADDRPAESSPPRASDGAASAETRAIGDADHEHVAALDSQQRGRVADQLRATEHPRQIGRYHILSVIGQGGMGIVYAAEQREPVRRRVALKLIKVGMDTREVLARFDAERQALAILDHPNIAKVFDAGATDLGRPYFVMEFVQGRPITDYCDAHRLTTRARLELFAQVCDAVQHAHMKGIIHRDIKASNVLVAVREQQDTPVPKLIDFGVAKATASRLTEQTLFTHQGALVGTPEYMSPEQAGTSIGADVDTRTDIYSLGVLLYELLAGALPFERGSLRGAAYHEIQRIIRDVEPPRPSTRLSRLGEAATEVARQRHTVVADLTSELKRELEWIPLKAMRKDRTERYRNATEFADDVRNYLAGRPLIAAPPSAWYRARKFVKRNKAAVAAVMVIVAALLAGIAGTTYQAIRATRAERAAEVEKLAAQRHFNDVRALANTFMFDFYERIANLAGATPAVKMLVDTSLKYLDSLASGSNDPALLRELATAYIRVAGVQGNKNSTANLGDLDGAMRSYQRAASIGERLNASAPNEPRNAITAAAAHEGIGDIQLLLGRPGEALAAFEQAKKLMPKPAKTGATTSSFNPTVARKCATVAIALEAKTGDVLLRMADTDAARRAYDRARDLALSFAKEHPGDPEADRLVMISHNKSGDVQRTSGKAAEALAEYRSGLEVARRLSETQPEDVMLRQDVGTSHWKIGTLLRDMGKSADALVEFRAANELVQRWAKSDPTNARAAKALAATESALGELMLDMGQVDAALASYRESERACREVVQANPQDVETAVDLAGARLGIARCLATLGKRDESIDVSRQAISELSRLATSRPDDDMVQRNLATAHQFVGIALMRLQEYREAAEAHRQAVAVDRRRLAKDPGSAEKRRFVAVDLAWLGEALAATADLPGVAESDRLARRRAAREAYVESLNIFTELQNLGASQARWNATADAVRQMLENLEGRLVSSTQPATQGATHRATTRTDNDGTATSVPAGASP